MEYTQANFESMTGKELDLVKAEFEQVGITPSGWGKMRVGDKRSWLKRNLDVFRKATSPAELHTHVREKKAWDALNGPAADPKPLTRQVSRQNQRRALKAFLSDQKAAVMKSKRMGGAASVLSVEVA